MTGEIQGTVRPSMGNDNVLQFFVRGWEAPEKPAEHPQLVEIYFPMLSQSEREEIYSLLGDNAKAFIDALEKRVDGKAQVEHAVVAIFDDGLFCEIRKATSTNWTDALPVSRKALNDLTDSEIDFTYHNISLIQQPAMAGSRR